MQDTGRQGMEMQARIAVAALASRLGMFAGMLGDGRIEGMLDLS